MRSRLVGLCEKGIVFFFSFDRAEQHLNLHDNSKLPFTIPCVLFV